jgi:endonuclease III
MSTARRTATAQVYNDMHGLLVAVGKNFCLKAQVRCEQCPLRELLPAKGPRLKSPSGTRRRVHSR